ncbi:MAG: histidinol-phosphate transaminase [Nitrospiraceae bacterium]|nr:histidinol-phosphate transaminase [Nitrospiraceae bacterium]
MIRPSEYVLDIQPYVPGKPLEELERELGIQNSIKLASNENPLGPSPAALKIIKSSIKNLNRYPDGSGYYLKKELSKTLSVNEDELILGNGSNELIDAAVRTFLKAGDEAVMAVPSFVVYSMSVKAVGGKPIQIPLKNYTHDLDAMADAVTSNTKIIFIANPNNPTGTINKKNEFDKMMSRISDDILIVVDEAYYEYVSALDYADSFEHFRKRDNLLILRTFSKIYGLAGLRIGYGIAKKEIINAMDRIREPFNTNTLAQCAALAALSDSRHVKKTKRINEKGKKYLYKELKSLGLNYIPTQANFIYMPVKAPMSLYEKLLKRGVIIRSMGLDAIRVTIGLKEENERFIQELKNIL